MSGSKLLIDSNIVIFLSKGVENIEKILVQYDEFYVSIISYMGIYGYRFTKPKEKELIDRFFETVNIVGLNKEIANLVIEYRKYSSKKIKLPDAIILASAKFLGAALLTDDWDDFSGIDKEVTILKIR